MAKLITTMTQRGQVTVPAEVRRFLGLKPRDKVTWEVKDGVVMVRRPKYTLETLAGSVPTPKRLQGRDVDELIREAKDEKARRDVAKGLYR